MARVYHAHEPVTQHPTVMMAEAYNVGDVTMRPGMLIRYDGTPPQVVEHRPDGTKRMRPDVDYVNGMPLPSWEKEMADGLTQARMSIAMQSRLQKQNTDNLLGLGANAYANAYRAPQEPTTADKLNAWYARLEERVAQIEADDAVMGKKETKRWMDELAAFKADLI